MDRRTFLAGLAASAPALAAAPANAAPRASQPPVEPPVLPRELRGLWIATVSNVDWPSRPGLSADAQQQELLAILDRARALNLNAIILQVRPACDALYESTKEPWSEYLTGTQGQSPGYDPLAFAVDAAHRRGLELHAWFNPYRARPSGGGMVAASHVCKTHPNLVRTYGKQRWLDPGEPAVRSHSLDVILDVVARYDIDGVHLDDYFYPYPEPVKGKPKLDAPFPDDPSYQKYRSTGGTLARDDWRRSNVDGFVELLYARVKALKPQVRVGISPFGIWRPGTPPQIKGLDPYVSLYADSRKWLMEGWVDYLAPQLYWRIDQTGQSFAVLALWWAMQNPKGRHLWPGCYTGKFSAVEIEYQARVTRGIAAATGNLHFSAKALMKGDLSDPASLAGHLGATVYAQPALAPASPWLGETVPEPPSQVVYAQGRVAWTPSSAAFVHAVQWRDSGQWGHALVPGDQSAAMVPGSADLVFVTTVDRLGNASRAVLAGA